MEKEKEKTSLAEKFVKNEFYNLDNLSIEDWLRKMDEYVAVHTILSKEVLDALDADKKFILSSAAIALKSHNRENHYLALKEIIALLTQRKVEDLDATEIAAIAFAAKYLF